MSLDDADAAQDSAPASGSEPAPEQLISFSNLGQLSGVFPIKHLPAAVDQGKPAWLLSMLAAFVQSLQVSWLPDSWTTGPAPVVRTRAWWHL